MALKKRPWSFRKYTHQLTGSTLWVLTYFLTDIDVRLEMVNRFTNTNE